MSLRARAPVPPVLKPARSDATTGYYEITQKAARQEMLPGLETEVWGYEGSFQGPPSRPQAAGSWRSGSGTSCPFPSPLTCTAA